ncbi:response regulator transcription factor [Sphingopyxis sp. R3-92]|uniref:response regulator transcription factor n=1 Tax=Sphingopyxis sp. R3-92 TaxID=3158553 RepID=UPI003EE4A510
MDSTADPAASSPIGTRRVYIVDDDQMVRRSTSFLLNSAGYLVRAFLSGRDFLGELAGLQPGITLLDVRMPDIDGLAVLEHMPSDLRQIFPVVVVTGHGDLPTAVRAMKLGAKDFLEKPFSEDALFEILETIFGQLADEVDHISRRDHARALIGRLSPRELDVLRGLIGGEPNKLVAHNLGLSVRTVEMHRAKMLDRLQVRTLPDAIRTLFVADLKL